MLFENDALHVEPQSIPAGLLVAIPEPVPFFATVNWKVVGAESVKVAVIDLAFDRVTWQVLPLAESQPLQLLKVDPGSGVAVSVTGVPAS